MKIDLTPEETEKLSEHIAGEIMPVIQKMLNKLAQAQYLREAAIRAHCAQAALSAIRATIKQEDSP